MFSPESGAKKRYARAGRGVRRKKAAKGQIRTPKKKRGPEMELNKDMINKRNENGG